MSRILRNIVLVFLLACAGVLQAQQLNVIEFRADFTLTDAVKYPKEDFNGERCCLIKLGLALPKSDVAFEGDIISFEYKEGEWWIYMPKGSNWLTIKSKSSAYLPLRYEFEGLQGNVTYVMNVERPAGYAQEPKQPIVPNTTGDDQIFTVNGVSFVMKFVEGGKFRMGAQNTNVSGQNYDKDADDDESPVHSVTLSSYYMGETEVTQALWKAVMDTNPSYWKGNDLPVETVSWNDCQEFIRKLNRLTGRNFRLPTEAEWEYAARGGNRSNGTKYAGSISIGSVAWYGDNSDSKTHTVKGKSPNELGLYDMSGNVGEWCGDGYDSYSSSSQTTPKVPSNGFFVYRGGGWIFRARACRVSARIHIYDSRHKSRGFRLCLPQ